MPSLAGAIRAGLGDLYYHSWRLVPANVVWSVTMIVCLLIVAVVPLGFVVLPVLAVPTAGLFRMTTRIARGEAVSFWDAAGAWRTGVGETLLVGGVLALSAIALSFNVASGLVTGEPLGWAFATLALWGLVATWIFAWTAWPILADPVRVAWPLRERLRLAALLALAHPVRIGVLGLVLGLLLAASVVTIVAILTVSVAIAALIAARFILPAADRLDSQLGISAARGPAEVSPAVR